MTSTGLTVTRLVASDSFNSHKTMPNTDAFLSATCSSGAKCCVKESLLKFADKPGLCGAKLRLSQVV